MQNKAKNNKVLLKIKKVMSTNFDIFLMRPKISTQQIIIRNKQIIIKIHNISSILLLAKMMSNFNQLKNFKVQY